MLKSTFAITAAACLVCSFSHRVSAQETSLTVYSSADPGNFDPLSYVRM